VAVAAAAGGKNWNPEYFFKNSDFEKTPNAIQPVSQTASDS